MIMGLHDVITLDDFERIAFSKLDQNTLDYYRSGANQEITLKDNIQAFSRICFRPRFLRDVSTRDLSTTILGQPISFPVCIAPSAMHKLAHPDGEVATARAAARAQTAMGLSTLSTTPLEEVASVSPSSPKFFQLYVYKNRNATRELVERAQRAGFKGLLLTIDTPFLGRRLADERNQFKLPPHLTLGNFSPKDTKSEISNNTGGSGLSQYSTDLLDPSLSWKDLKWLKSITNLPIVLKGILTAEDAILAVEHGIDGILVSNHGARQLDGDPATIDVLREVVEAVKGKCEVYLDGGVRTGTDVLKALALGARCVFIGRPVLWGLTHSGEDGVRKVLEILRKEFDLAMALAGCRNVSEITPALVAYRHCVCRL